MFMALNDPLFPTEAAPERCDYRLGVAREIVRNKRWNYEVDPKIWWAGHGVS
ncbi:hypothetical protein DPMN_140418 [Dreissena polymorpha]|uniref:Uncharacterized protein n=1 Tax=Dreissena polymorpha TaxID=45954 RepID=A0A9D4JKD1_DREPO|nr:hypothetical protein DPMN_140418 [Dreissena polymorpha]